MKTKSLSPTAGYKNDHHLIEEKIAPPSIIELRTELALPRHRDIFELAKRGANFSECIGIIAAELGVILDGLYDVEPLAAMLVEKLRNRGLSILSSSDNHGLVPARLQETEDTIEIRPVLDSFTRMMHEANCHQCDNKAACMKAGNCLGEDSRSELGFLTKEQKKEFGI